MTTRTRWRGVLLVSAVAVMAVAGLSLVTPNPLRRCATPDAFPKDLLQGDVSLPSPQGSTAGITIGPVLYDAGAVFVAVCGGGAVPTQDVVLVMNELPRPAIGGALGIPEGDGWSQVAIFANTGPGDYAVRIGSRDVARVSLNPVAPAACPRHLTTSSATLIQCGSIWSLELPTALEAGPMPPDLVEGDVTDPSGTNLGFYLMGVVNGADGLVVQVGFNPPPSEVQWIEVRVYGLLMGGRRVTPPPGGWPVARVTFVP